MTQVYRGDNALRHFEEKTPTPGRGYAHADVGGSGMEERILSYLRVGDWSEVEGILQTFVPSDTFFDSTPVYTAVKEGIAAASRSGDVGSVEHMVELFPEVLMKYPEVKEVVLHANIVALVPVCKELSGKYVYSTKKEFLYTKAVRHAEQVKQMSGALGIDQATVERIAVQVMFRDLAQFPQAQDQYIRIFREHVSDLSPENISVYRLPVLLEMLRAGEYAHAAYVADQLSCSMEERERLGPLIQKAIEELDTKGMTMHADALRDVLVDDRSATHLPLSVRLAEVDKF